MDINKFCVNDKTCGSCWGTLVAFDKLEELISYETAKWNFSKGCMNGTANYIFGLKI